MITKEEIKERMQALDMDYEELARLVRADFHRLIQIMKYGVKLSKNLAWKIDYELSKAEGKPVSKELPENPTKEDINRCRYLNGFTVGRFMNELETYDTLYRRDLEEMSPEFVERCRKILSPKQEEQEEIVTETSYRPTQGIWQIGYPGEKIIIKYKVR